MFESLNKLNSLPEDTKIYSAHEYTESNLKWALTLEPDNIYIIGRLKLIQNKLQKGMCSLPSTLLEERKTNLFLIAENPNIAAISIPKSIFNLLLDPKTPELLTSMRSKTVSSLSSSKTFI